VVTRAVNEEEFFFIKGLSINSNFRLHCLIESQEENGRIRDASFPNNDFING